MIKKNALGQYLNGQYPNKKISEILKNLDMNRQIYYNITKEPGKISRKLQNKILSKFPNPECLKAIWQTTKEVIIPYNLLTKKDLKKYLFSIDISKYM